MKALCIKSISVLDETEENTITIFQEGKTYQVWEGFNDKKPVLYSIGEDDEVYIVEEDDKLENSKEFKQKFEIISYC